MSLTQANGLTVNYRWDGPDHGPVVMMAHSLGADLTMWDPQVKALTGAGLRLLRYDLRGHGASAVPAGPYTLEQLSADAVGLMDALGLPKVHFIGLSLGGMIGQMLGFKFPQRLLSLVLCSTSAHMPPREIWEERIQTVTSKGLGALVDATMDRWFTKAGQQRLASQVQKIRAIYLKTTPQGFAGCCAAIRDMDLRPGIRTIDRPTLIMVGEHDQGTPVAAARMIHEAILLSKLVVIAEAAHLQNIEQEDRFNRTLLEFFSEVAGEKE
ncbi:MAG: 3-oxoadipate enol-lactonase [Desulfobacteraceae bacterium]|nr:3-oxoadipate enol-lactonase [Desulfobacteraceae bacterium]